MFSGTDSAPKTTESLSEAPAVSGLKFCHQLVRDRGLFFLIPATSVRGVGRGERRVGRPRQELREAESPVS